MSTTRISRASSELLLIEQDCPEVGTIQTVILTSHDLLDLCILAWPHEVKKWIDRDAEVFPSFPPDFEKIPQDAPKDAPGALEYFRKVQGKS